MILKLDSVGMILIFLKTERWPARHPVVGCEATQ